MEHREKLAALTKRALASDQMTDSDDVEFGNRKDESSRVRTTSRNSSDVMIGTGAVGEQHLLISSDSDSNEV